MMVNINGVCDLHTLFNLSPDLVSFSSFDLQRSCPCPMCLLCGTISGWPVKLVKP